MLQKRNEEEEDAWQLSEDLKLYINTFLDKEWVPSSKNWGEYSHQFYRKAEKD